MNFIGDLTNSNLQTLYFYNQNDYPKKNCLFNNSYEQIVFFNHMFFNDGGSKKTKNTFNNYDYLANIIKLKKNSKKITSNKNACVEFIDNENRICVFIDRFVNKYESKLIYGCKIKGNKFCLIGTIDYKTKKAVIQTLQEDKKCLYKDTLPNQVDINKIMEHFIDFCRKEKMKYIYLTDNSYITCGKEKRKVHLSEIFILKTGKPYYSERFGFIPEQNDWYNMYLHNIHIMSKTKWNDKKIKWMNILNLIKNKDEYSIIIEKLIECKNENCILTDFIKKLGNKMCDSWEILVNHLFTNLQLHRMYGIVFILKL